MRPDAVWQGSSVGESARLIIVRSRVQAPLLLRKKRPSFWGASFVSGAGSLTRMRGRALTAGGSGCGFLRVDGRFFRKSHRMLAAPRPMVTAEGQNDSRRVAGVRPSEKCGRSVECGTRFGGRRTKRNPRRSTSPDSANSSPPRERGSARWDPPLPALAARGPCKMPRRGPSARG